MVAITKVSSVSGKEHTREIPVDTIKYLNWTRGNIPGLIQDIFPELSADDREFLMTGITPEEWDDIFGEPEAEEDN